MGRGNGQSGAERLRAAALSAGVIVVALLVAGWPGAAAIAGPIAAAASASGTQTKVSAKSAASDVLPQGGVVAAGSATIAQPNGAILALTQTSNRAVINWTSFSVGPSDTVTFAQPSAESAILNRVSGDTSSAIAGQIIANGQVYLVNPNGIAITATGSVRVGGGFVASTLGLSDTNFMAGNYNFLGDGSSAAVSNAGTISVGYGGFAALLGGSVDNAGVISAPVGKIALGSGEQATLDLNGDGFLQVAVPTGATASDGKALIDVSGQLVAGGGRISLSVATAKDAVRDAVNISGSLSATSVSGRNGSIDLTAGPGGDVTISGQVDASQTSATANVFDLSGQITAVDASGDGGSVAIQAATIVNTGAINATGASGGSVGLSSDFIGQYGLIDVSGAKGAGGSLSMQAGSGGVLETASSAANASGATAGGQIAIDGASVYLSGANIADASEGAGGAVIITGATINLFGATIDADGASGGGTIRIGGDLHGGGALPAAATVNVGPTTSIGADASGRGDGGSVVVWSSMVTDFMGAVSAKGGPVGGDGGAIEVSSGGNLTFGGMGDASAPAGAAGSLLLDPKNIVISSATAAPQQIPLVDPMGGAGDGFGSQVLSLTNGNVVVAAPGTNVGGAADAGAIYLFNATTGTLISALTGSHANDDVGNAGALGPSNVNGVVPLFTQLTNGNFVVSDPAWNGDAGAVTWGSAVTGVNGVISSSNSLVGSLGGPSFVAAGCASPGSATGDCVGSGLTGLDGVTALSNGNYAVFSPFWNGGAGAVTWVNGANGHLVTGNLGGAVSATNSLIDLSSASSVIYVDYGPVPGTTGNYVVESAGWNNNTGAFTWVNGATGQMTDGTFAGAVSASNSLVGGAPGETLPVSAPPVVVTALANGDFVAADSGWSSSRGAATWIGPAGIAGPISASNSLVGSSPNDQVGADFDFDTPVVTFANGNYLVLSPFWNGTAGAVTWVDGANGELDTGAVGGPISASNSLIGATGGASGDEVGSNRAIVLPNGDAVVLSPTWNGRTGAATWIDGSTGHLVGGATGGGVSASNSLTGASPHDETGTAGFVVGGDNYVVVSEGWNSFAGAVTWGNGATGAIGVVSSANSLVGSHADDLVGEYGVAVLTNGNYVVPSPAWNGYAGAVTWVNGSNGQLVTGSVGGAVSATSSLVGSTSGGPCDQFGGGGGDCVGGVFEDNESGNTVVSTEFYFTAGFGVQPLPNGNYVVQSPFWNADRGAVTWGNGATGTVGTVSAANSLVGSTPGTTCEDVPDGDCLGAGAPDHGGVYVLSNSNYVVDTPSWGDAFGAVTWGNGASGTSGVVSASNSLVGSLDPIGVDQVGDGGVTPLTNGNYVVDSPDWNDVGASNTRAGAITWVNGSNGQLPSGQIGAAVSEANSLFGDNFANAGGNIGFGATIFPLPDGDYVVISPQWNGGTGAVTLGNGATGTTGAISASNSLVGDSCEQGASGICLANQGCTAAIGGIPDCIGEGGVDVLPNSGYLVLSPFWDNGAGAVTYGAPGVGVTGAVSSANSQLGNPGDGLGVNAGVISGPGAIPVQVTGDGYIVDDPKAGAVKEGFIAPSGNAGGLAYADDPSQTVTLTPAAVAAILDNGTDLTLQANDDITVSDAISVPGSTGGALTLDAGRSLLLNASIGTANGNVTLIANDNLSDGVVDADRDPGAAVIDMAAGSAINAGTGAVVIELLPGTGKTNADSGAITLGSISARTITVENSGATTDSDVVLGGGASLVSSENSGTSISVASDNGVVTNDAGAGALQPGAGSRYVIFSDGPSDTALDGLTPASQTSVTLADFVSGTAPALASGNFVLYREAAEILTVTAESFTRDYGDANPTLTYVVTGFQSGQTAGSVLSGAPALSTSATAASGVGQVVIAIAPGTLTNSCGCVFDFVNGALTINPRPLTYAIAGASSVYGAAADPAVTLTGSVNSDQVTATVGLLNASNSPVALGARTQVGTYSEVVTALSNPNYSIAAAGNTAGTLVISPLAITYTVASATSTYGSVATTGVSLNGVLAGDDVTGNVTVTTSGGASTTLAANTPAGTYTAAVTGLSGPAAEDYALAASGNQSGTLVIDPKAITYAVANASSTYGSTAAPGAVTLNGVLAGDVVGGTVLVSTTSGAPVTLAAKTDAGGYVETVNALSGASAGNYVIAVSGDTSGTLTINPATITYSVADASSTYGATATPGAATLTGVLAGDMVTPAVAIATSDGGAVNLAPTTAAGSYREIVNGLSGPSASNYVIATSGDTAGALVINPLAITFAVADATSTYGAPATPAVTLNGVLAADQVAGSLSVTTSAGTPVVLASNTPVGSYATGVNGLIGAAAANYVIAASGNQTGTLTIDPKTITYSVANAAATYGTMASPGAASLDGVLAGDTVTASVVISGPGGTPVTLVSKTTAGSYQETVGGLSGTSASNYVIASSGDTNGTLTINPVAITYAVANASAAYGAQASAGIAALNGVLAGDSLTGVVTVFDAKGESVTLTATTPAGAYPEKVTGLTGSAASDYVLAQTGNTPGVLTITPPAGGSSLAAAWFDTLLLDWLAAPSCRLDGGLGPPAAEDASGVHESLRRNGSAVLFDRPTTTWRDSRCSS